VPAAARARNGGAICGARDVVSAVCDPAFRVAAGRFVSTPDEPARSVELARTGV